MDASYRQSKTSSSGGDFQCVKCGAEYEVTLWHRPKEERDYALCQKCLSVMFEWSDSVARSFKFKSPVATVASTSRAL
jgi:hypothetical protein